MSITQPVRGAVRLDDLRFDPAGLASDLARFADDWVPDPQSYGDAAWSRIKLIDASIEPDGRDPRLDESPHFREIVESFPSKCVLMLLTRLDAGSTIRRHRDMNGGTVMGVARFHVPIITNADVEFSFEDETVQMRAGETWAFDTTYMHGVENRSDIDRVHVIIDVELNDEIKAMLPERDWRDRAHDVRFLMAYAAKASRMMRHPTAVASRAWNFARLKVLGPERYHRARALEE